ncbi:RPS6KB2 [Cordylochernes scorpioides]|uniref:RPS6KB2 n=1 Tax=Cordylochernes scorpioides TaxID=51811 RepID=A0ABY6LHI6_9ARAC|nr:RPS6KB2 [Cordylochernes scorpioides]
MELVKGRDLYHYMNKWKNFSEEASRFYAAETAIAINYLHSHHVIHRDVKPENILINFDGHIKLVDYGLSKTDIYPGDMTTKICGTVQYMAPEIWKDIGYSYSVDWWALGVILFEIMTGITAKTAPDTREEARWAASLNIILKAVTTPKQLSNDAISVVKQFLRPNPKDRLGSNHEYGYANIQIHPFFQPLSFSSLEQKENIFGLEKRLPYESKKDEPIESQRSEDLPITRTIRLEDFHKFKKIGSGAFGTVRIVKDRKTNKVYARKTIKKKEGFQDTFRAEEKVLKICKGFPFLIELVASFEGLKKNYLVMELVKGRDLYHYMNKWKNFSEEASRFYAAETAIAINYLHSHHVIHRDVKPENILINFDGHIKLVDYGLSKTDIYPGDMTTKICGTVQYMAPEIWKDVGYSYSVDWWALGVILFEIMTGITAKTAPDTREEARWAASLNIILKAVTTPKQLSNDAISVVKQFLRPNPKDRLGSNHEYGYANIQIHPFFQPLSFSSLEQKLVEPPYIPDYRDFRM